MSGLPHVQNTALGWVVGGKIQGPTISHSISSHHVLLDLSSQLKDFWEIEEVGMQRPPYSLEEKQCETHFIQTHTRNSSGQYTVRLPFNKEEGHLGTSFDTAVNRLKQVERRLTKQPYLKQEYIDFMQEYLDLGHMRRIPPEEIESPPGQHYYLPHHAVLKDTSSTTHLRVVFDGSDPTSSGVSLNHRLMVGPTIQPDLVDIILRFRLHAVAFIAKMYRQVRIHDEDTNFQRIVWRESSDKQIEHFKLMTVTYGTASAPFLATRSLQQLARDEETNFPLASQATLKDFYVDDILSGASDSENALRLQSQLINILKSGGFQLRKWSSSDPSLLSNLDPSLHETKSYLVVGNTELVKTLGVLWNPTEDYFSFVIALTPSINTTKRKILSEFSRLFDPLGWLSPIVILAKILIQRLWMIGASWDEQLPPFLLDEWKSYTDQFVLLQSLKIKRFVLSNGKEGSVQIHGFCDASEKAFGAVIYLRSTDQQGNHSTHLLCSKTRVAPLKQLSLPRLELCGAVLLARLLNKLLKSLNLKMTSVRAWTDSTIVLCWISGHPNKWKTFVANRASEIQTLIPPEHWNHVSSEENPADHASRGLTPSEIINNTKWWHGPSWLNVEESFWPLKKGIGKDDARVDKEKKQVKTFLVSTDLSTRHEFLHRFSTLSSLQRITSYCLRFLRYLRTRKEQRTYGPLTTQDLHQSLLLWIKTCQEMEFQEEIHQLKTNRSLKSTSKLLSFCPFLDENGLLRVGGRLSNSTLSFDKKYPILLPKGHHLTKLIVEHQHIISLHAGPQLLLASLHNKYWIIGGRDLARRVVHTCSKCFRLRAKTSSQLMGDLPAHRIEPARAFLRCGVDFGGPLFVRLGKGRGRIKTQKAYIAVFICFATKAVHIDVVSDLSSEAFLATLRRFVSRRGKCTDIYSDNGTNFVGARREIKELFDLFQNENHKIASSLAKDTINWHMIPPASPHFGGIWEAGIKSVKQHLRKVVGNTLLTFEELYTVVTQVKACLNSRPLCLISTNPNDLSVLTPGHFLIGDSLTAIPEPDLTQLNINRHSRWQFLQGLTQHFWKRWRMEYLSSLQQRPKWATKTPNIAIDDLVIVKEDKLPPLKWILARVTDVHPGKDGLVRVATLKTATGVLKRTITKLCPLPLNT